MDARVKPGHDGARCGAFAELAVSSSHGAKRNAGVNAARSAPDFDTLIRATGSIHLAAGASRIGGDGLLRGCRGVSAQSQIIACARPGEWSSFFQEEGLGRL